MARTRREILGLGGGAIAAVGLAGCIGDDGDEPGDEEDDHDDDDHNHDDGAAEDDDHEDEDHDHDDDHDDEELEDAGLAEFELIDLETDEVTAYVHGDHWDESLPQIPVDGSISLGAYIEDEDGEEIELGDEYELNAEVAEGAQEGIVEIETHGDHVDLIGEDVGLTELVFQLWHDDHSDYDSPPLDAEVVEEVVEDAEDDDNDHDDNDHDDHDHDDDGDDHDHEDDD